jgi:hypothetical protein
MNECIEAINLIFSRFYNSCVNRIKKGKVEERIEIVKELVLRGGELKIDPD